MKKSIDEVIGMAWSDKISFEEIKKKSGLSESEVISIMRKNLKKKKLHSLEKKSTRSLF